MLSSPKVFMFNIFADLLPERAKQLRAALANQTAKHRPGIVVAHHPMNDIAARQMTAPFMGEFPSNIKYSMHISGHTHTRNYIRYPSGTLELNSQASFVCTSHTLHPPHETRDSQRKHGLEHRKGMCVCGRLTTTS